MLDILPTGPPRFRQHSVFQIPRLPLVVRTAADIEALRANARAVRRMPREGLRVAIAGLDQQQAEDLEQRIRSYIRCCGCAEGGAAALVAMLVVAVLLALKMAARGPRWADLKTAAVGLLVSVLLAGLGKLLGLKIARLRFDRCCRNTILIVERGV